MPEAPKRLVHESLLVSARRRPNKTAVVVEGRSYTYAELLDSSLRLARGLQHLGLERGDRVAVYMDNTWPCTVAVYAALLAGGVLMVVNPQTKQDKLAYILADSEASFLVTDGQLARWFKGLLEPGAPGGHTLKAVVCAGSIPESSYDIASFDALIARSQPAPADPGTIPLDLAALIYTSGSTGQPKGVMMSHQNMVFIMGSVIQYLELDAEDRILNVLPLAFSYGLYQLLMAVDLGATLVLERSFSYPAQVLQRLRLEQATVFPAVPTVFASLIALCKREGLTFPSVTRVTNAAAALPVAFVPELQQGFPNARIYQMYGLTECKRVCYLDPDLVLTKPSSVGRAIPGTEAFLLSETGEPVAPGDMGILHVRGPHVMLGYWKQPELTAQMLKPGRYPGERVLCTQDYFRMDEDGLLYFVGRSDDVINTRGEKVSPVEVENVLYDIRGVREAAVIGVPDDLLGEAVCAYIVPEEGAQVSEREIRRICLNRLESYMVPKQIVLVSELPKTASGKIRKQSLREGDWLTEGSWEAPSTSGVMSSTRRR